MPTTRKSAAAPAKQSKLSFAHRVTKPVPKSVKDLASPSPLSKEIVLEKATSPPPKPIEEVEADLEEQQTEDVAEAGPTAEKSEAELKAEQITDAQVGKYWKRLEAERVASRVHQEDLTVGEKVLRYFDVSSQYGPCIGITRAKRWMRAERLGLNPPIEVLAVLLKDEKKGARGGKRAHMDEIMNSTAVGAS